MLTGCRYYLVFAICGFTNALVIWAFFPETKGKSLEEMDAVFGDQVIPHALATGQTQNVKDEKRGSPTEEKEHIEA